MGLRAIKLMFIVALAGQSSYATVESEKELLAIERAHAAVSEIKSDFYQSLRDLQKKGKLRKSLPGCRIKNFKPDQMKVGRTSVRLRNPRNEPPDWTKPYLMKFSTAKRSEIPEHVLTKLGPHRYGYLEPIFVEPICLSCHGSQVSEDVRSVIKETYPNDQALGYEVGDFRGLLWLEVKD